VGVRIRHHFACVAEPSSPIVEHRIDLFAASRSSVQFTLFSNGQSFAPFGKIGELKG
jgi:hypothetical protein